MSKHYHEFRDPIHNFIRVSSDERKIIDSPFFQRLRHIHQLATTYLIYPSATHKRFEHSLGVMELSGRVFEIITQEDNLADDIRNLIPPREEFAEWKKKLKIAALLHDVGHLPFSHAAENELLPPGIKHENITLNLILDSSLTKLLKTLGLQPEFIAKIAVGPKIYKTDIFNIWEAILSEIIIGNSFGVDRIDYLLRDSYHVGVAYGKFDHYRLIDTLRLLQYEAKDDGRSTEPAIGIEEGGINVAESLLLARYLMFSQVYFHPVRRAYDIHLKDFLIKWLPNGKFSIKPEEFLKVTDNEVNSAIQKSADDHLSVAHKEAQRIVKRQHFRHLYSLMQSDFNKNPNIVEELLTEAMEKYGKDNIKRDFNLPKKAPDIFPVLLKTDERVVSSLERSSTLNQIPLSKFDYIFAEPKIFDQAHKWLKDKLDQQEK